VLAFTDLDTGPAEHRDSPHFCIVRRVSHGNKFKGARKEHIPGQNCGRHIPFCMDGRDTSACHIPVHDIIVDERETMSELQSKGGGHQVDRTPFPDGIGRKNEHDRTQSFASRQEEMGTCLPEFSTGLSKIAVDELVDLCRSVQKIILQIHRDSPSLIRPVLPACHST